MWYQWYPSNNNFWQILHQASDSACRLNQDGESDTTAKRQRQCKDTERDKMVRPYGLKPELQHFTRMFHMRGTTLLRVSWYQCHFRCPSWIHLAVSLDSFHFGCLGFVWNFSYLPEVIEALGQDPRTLCALWSGTGEEDHNKKTTGRQYRNTIFLEVLPDRALHSSWPMLFFHFHSENSNCHVSVNFPESQSSLILSYDGFHLYIPLYCQNVEIKRQCGTRTRGRTRSFGVHSFLHT